MKRNLPYTLSRIFFQCIAVCMVLVLGAYSKGTFAQTSTALNFANTDPGYFPVGGGNYATVDGGNLITTGSYTKEAWIRISDASGSALDARNILSETNSSFYVYANGQLAAGQKPSYSAKVKDPTPLVVGQWYHVAVTFNPNTDKMVLYKDGVQVATLTNASMDLAPADLTNSTIGAIYFSSKYGFGFRGDIAELRVWNYERSAGEILLTYQCGLPSPTAGVVAYYKFSDGIAGGDNTAVTNLNDATSNGNDATLHGFTLTGTSSNFIGDFNELTGTCSVVPITLSYFTAQANNQTAHLTWQTTSEMNNKGFTIERSADGTKQWQAIGFVAGSGSSSTITNYQFVDENPLAGKNFYRLVQTDFDGNATFSKIALVQIAGLNRMSLYPTVTSGVIYLNTSDDALLKTPFSIFDNFGRIVSRGEVQSQHQAIDVSRLQSGVYYLKLQNNEGMKFIRK